MVIWPWGLPNLDLRGVFPLEERGQEVWLKRAFPIWELGAKKEGPWVD